MDNAAGTPIDREVLAAMNPYFSMNFFNPGSLYSPAVTIRNQLNQARTEISQYLSCRPQEIIFCDGGTAVNNLALRGLVFAWREKNREQIPHIITTSIEHASILETCRDLEKNNLARITYIPVNKLGLLDIKFLKKALTPDTILISIGYVNGEIGVIQDIQAITKIVRHYRKQHASAYPYIHSDAIQAVNYIPLNIQTLGIDLMTISASKIYGPKKIGALYKKANITIAPMITGGNQEFGLCAGTENIPAIIGFAKAFGKTRDLLDTELLRLHNLQTYFIEHLQKNIPDITVNTYPEYAIPNIVNISIPDISSEEIVLRLDVVGIQASVKSACKNLEEGDSHVIRALRSDNTQSIRFSMGRYTRKKDIDYTVRELSRIVAGMRDTFQNYGDRSLSR